MDLDPSTLYELDDELTEIRRQLEKITAVLNPIAEKVLGELER